MRTYLFPFSLDDCLISLPAENCDQRFWTPEEPFGQAHTRGWSVPALRGCYVVYVVGLVVLTPRIFVIQTYSLKKKKKDTGGTPTDEDERFGPGFASAVAE